MRSIAIALVLLWSAAAGAVPKTINFTGRLTTSSGPVDGAVNITLKLFADATGGTDIWNEVHNNVGADDGLVFLDIGSSTTLDDTVLDGRRVFLEITVGNETLAPRLAFNSVPYAVRTDAAATADSLGGSIGPGDVVTTVTGAAGLAATKTGNAVTVGLTTAGCSNGQVFKFNGTTFACAADAVGSFTPGNGIAISGTTISLATTNCSNGQVLKFNGTAFACAADAAGSLTPGNGIAISGTTISLATTNCSSGQVLKFDGTGFSCQADAVGTFTATAGNGIAVSGSTISLATTNCSSGQVLKFNGTGFSCQADAVGTFTATAGNGIAVSGSTISLATTNCSSGQALKFNGTGFSCQADAVGLTAAAPPLVLTNSGTTVSLPTTCTANQVLRWNATTMTWVCGPAFTAGSCTWAVLRATTTAVSTLTVACTNKHAISGGCTASAGAVINSIPAGPPGDGDPVGQVIGWSCAFNTPAVNHLAYALCCDTI